MMERTLKAIFGMAMLPMCLFAQEKNDSTTNWWEREMNLHEVVVVGTRTVVKQSPDRIVYLTKNDNYAKGLNGIEVLDRIPRVSVVNDLVTVAGKSSVRYIVDGRLHHPATEKPAGIGHREDRIADYSTSEVRGRYKCSVYQHYNPK